MKINIFILWLNNSGTAIEHVEFSSKENCEEAKALYLNDADMIGWNQYGAICVEK